MSQKPAKKLSDAEKAALAVPWADWMSDIHLLIGGLFNIGLPILAFCGAIVMVRFADDYKACVMKQHKLTEEKYLTQTVESQRFWIRVLQANIYCLSISYFFFIYKATVKWWRIFNLLFYTLVLLSFIGCGLGAMTSNTKSKCKDTNYAKANMALALVEIASGALLLILHAALSVCYKSSGRLPECIVAMEADVQRRQASEIEMKDQ